MSDGVQDYARDHELLQPPTDSESTSLLDIEATDWIMSLVAGLFSQASASLEGSQLEASSVICLHLYYCVDIVGMTDRAYQVIADAVKGVTEQFGFKDSMVTCTPVLAVGHTFEMDASFFLELLASRSLH